MIYCARRKFLGQGLSMNFYNSQANEKYKGMELQTGETSDSWKSKFPVAICKFQTANAGLLQNFEPQPSATELLIKTACAKAQRCIRINS